MSQIIEVAASNVQVIAPAAPVVGERKVDTSRGTSNTRVSSQFWKRPADQRFLSLSDLHAFTLEQALQSFADIVDVSQIKTEAERENPDSFRMLVPSRTKDRVVAVEPTHWSFQQMCSLLSSADQPLPASYLRTLPAPLTAINMQYALSNFRPEHVKTYVRENGTTELRAATGPDYGRIMDHEVVAAVQRIAGNGVSDTHWKVPGLLNWGTMKYDPYSEVTKQTTTLFASDRDVFVFLVDDLHPIEIGKLADGSPDYVFRGFMVWNSEVGSKSLGVATFYLRATCCNRILWGVEGYSEIILRHSKNAPMRFAGEVGPALESFASAGTTKFLTGVKAARDAIVANTDATRNDWLGRQGFTKPQSKQIIESVLSEEGKAPESVWDFVQGITATARRITHSDDRVAMERRAGAILDKIAA